MKHLLAATSLALLLASPAGAQGRDTARAGATISGVVYDSIAKQPLAAATVQLVSSDSMAKFVRTVPSDSRGRFTFAAIPDGSYLIGFIHDKLDDLGLEPIVRALRVENASAKYIDLAIPSPATVRTAICGSRSADSSGVLVGVVRDARDGAPASGATVIAEWLELDVSAFEITAHRPSIKDTARDNGWFVLCNVPSPGEITLVAGRAADSTDRLKLSVPADGFLRRDLYVGSARTDVPNHPLSGTVTTVQGSRPVPDAIVSVANGLQTRTNERGEWTLPDAPPGTRRLEIRAVGYYPGDRPVDIIASAPPVRVSLYTMRAMLDTIKVSATRLSPNMRGFEERRRASGMGRFLTPEYITQRRAHNTSELFRMVPGMFVERPTGGDLGPNMILMRGTFADRCVPAFYLNGSYAGVLSGNELDAFVSPDEVAGIEIYRDPIVPAQFNARLGGEQCGSIVVWTRPALGPRSQASLKKRALQATVIIGTAWAIGALVFRR